MTKNNEKVDVQLEQIADNTKRKATAKEAAKKLDKIKKEVAKAKKDETNPPKPKQFTKEELEQAKALIEAAKAKEVKTTVDLVEPVKQVISENKGMARLVGQSAQGHSYKAHLMSLVLDIVGRENANTKDVFVELDKQLY